MTTPPVTYGSLCGGIAVVCRHVAGLRARRD
jgi:hypothetical protein